MQHPVGYRGQPEATGRAELNDFRAVLTNNDHARHVPARGLRGLHDRRRLRRRHLRLAPGPPASTPTSMRPSMRLGACTLLVAGVLVAITGDFQAKVMTEQQPMKMAAAEALCETESNVAFSLFTIGTLDGSERDRSRARSRPARPSWPPTTSSGEIEGINDLAGPVESSSSVRATSPPERAGHLLVVPADDRLRRPGGAVRAVDAVGLPQGQHPAVGAHAEAGSPGSGSRPSSSRCWPTPSAGSSPRWAASPGSSTGCC